jgi:hypothetical protein
MTTHPINRRDGTSATTTATNHTGSQLPTMPRPLTLNTKGSTKRARWLRATAPIIITSIVALGGCNNDASGGESQPPATTSPPATIAPTPEDQALEAWQTVLASFSQDPTAVAAAQQVADPEALKGARPMLDGPARASSNASAVTQADGTVEIKDCVFMDPPTNKFEGTLGYRAEARKVGDSWRITHAQLFGKAEPSNTGFVVSCVPKSLEADVVSAYRDYWDVRSGYDKESFVESAAVRRVATGSHLEHVEKLKTDWVARNAEWRNHPILHPEVMRVTSPTEVRVRDCQMADSESGLFDRSTGARLPDQAPETLGSRNLAEADMKLEGGQWKIASLAYGTGATCTFAPSDLGLAIL